MGYRTGPTDAPPRTPDGAPRAAPILLGIAAKAKRRARAPGIREQLLDSWLATATKGDCFVYHRGELARDALQDPDLAAVAARLRELSTGIFTELSRCGHERGETIGAGQLELATRRDRDETVYFARKR